MLHLDNFQTYQLQLKSSDDQPREAAPNDWYPTIADLMVNEDELDLIPTGVWFHYFDGGHNGLHYVMQDGQSRFFYIDGAFGRWDLAGPKVGGDYDNAYDAFWAAEQEAGVIHSDTPQQTA